MPNLVSNLIIDRVDLVDEGANSAAFIELFKRKEKTKTMDVKEILSKMKPEHAEVIEAELEKAKTDLDNANAELEKAKTDLETSSAELEKAKTDLEASGAELEKANSVIALYKAADYCSCDGEEDEDGICTECNKPKNKAKGGTGFDEEETLKSMPEAARELFYKMRSQKEAAENEVRKAKEAEAHAEAVSKAATLKSLPIESDTLVSLLKGGNEDLFACLTTINNAIDGVVLNEVGKSRGEDTKTGWDKIEKEAEIISKRDNVSIQKAIATVIKEKPELYQEYLQEV